MGSGKTASVHDGFYDCDAHSLSNWNQGRGTHEYCKNVNTSTGNSVEVCRDCDVFDDFNATQ